MQFQRKCITMGASRHWVYSSTSTISRLMVTTLKVGTIPASSAPPCRKVKRAVVTMAAATVEYWRFIS